MMRGRRGNLNTLFADESYSVELAGGQSHESMAKIALISNGGVRFDCWVDVF
jgi:hypothetical protein